MKLSEPINLEFTRENTIKIFLFGENPVNSPFSHKQIAEWCERFWNKYSDVDAPEEIEILLSALADVETQWDLYLVNTYTLEELQKQDFENVVLPVKWFTEWLREINA
jgi:hypothetical protein